MKRTYDGVDAAIQGFGEYPKNSKEKQIIMANNSNINRNIFRGKKKTRNKFEKITVWIVRATNYT